MSIDDMEGQAKILSLLVLRPMGPDKPHRIIVGNRPVERGGGLSINDRNKES